MAVTVTVIPADCQSYRIRVAGVLDTAGVPEFEKGVASAMSDPDVRCLRLELDELQFISSLGIGAIAKARKAIEGRGGLMVTIGMQPQIKRVFDVVRMLPKETVFASREEADEYLAMIQTRVLESQSEQQRPHP